MIATLTALFAEVHRDEKRRHKAFTVEDFLPSFDGKVRERNTTPVNPEMLKAALGIPMPRRKK